MVPKKEIFLGYACSNDCIFCPYQDKKSMANPPREEIERKLRDAYSRGLKNLLFKGGEPLEREDFAQILDFAINLGFERIGVHTNAKTLFGAFKIPFRNKEVFFDEKAYWFIERLSYFRIKVCGHTPQLHESITRCEGSFSKTIQAIKNIANIGRFLEIEILIGKKNYLFLDSIIEYIFHLPRINRIRLRLMEKCPLSEEDIKRIIDKGLLNNIWILTENIYFSNFQNYNLHSVEICCLRER